MKISIIIPVYNEGKLISECLNALISQDYPKEDYEIVVVNDGSTDNTLEAIQRKQKESEKKGTDIKIVNLEKNQGRAITRETGAKSTKYDNLLFIDARCIAAKDLLKILKNINYQPIIGNPIIDLNRSSFDKFNWLIRKKIYSSYFGESFKPAYITKDNFDKMPKGTTVFFCSKEIFLSSQLEDKGKDVSDDTKLLWNIVQKKKILKHPNVKITYLPRTSLKKEIKHTFQRGPKFVDYYLNPHKKYFWLFIFLPIITLIFTITLIFINLTYFLYWLGFLILIWLIVSIWFSENIEDFFIMFSFLPIIGLSFEIGIFRGLLLKLVRRCQMEKFDYKNYWEKRHIKDVGDIRTVGLKSFSEKANRVSYLLIQQQYDKLLNKINIWLKNKNVLDAGAGIGMYIPFFLNKGADVTAIDISDDAINYLRLKFPKVNCIAAGLEDIDEYFQPNQFYFVHCFDVLYHITDDAKWEKSIRNLALVSNKYIALHEQFSTKKPILCSKHIKWRNRETVITELAKNNFYEIGSIPTTVIRRLFTYKILGFFPSLYYKLDKFLLNKDIAYRNGASFIKIFEKRI